MDHAPGPRTGHARTARSRRTRTALVEGTREELRSSGSFTAELVAARADCSPATFYSHFGTKDDALTAAFGLVLDELVTQSRRLLTIDRIATIGLEKCLDEFVDHQADFFAAETLVFRAALARLSQHRELRNAYRAAEAATLDHLRQLILAGQDAGHIELGSADVLAEAVLVLAQGINNPHAIRADAGLVRAELAFAMAAILAPPEAELGAAP